MNKSNLMERVNCVRQDLERLGEDLTAMEQSEPVRYPENYTELAIEAAIRAERLTCSMRQLVYISGSKKAEYLSQAATAQGVKIRYEGDCIEITLPAQLPGRWKKSNSEFLVDPVFFALSEFTMVHRVPRLEHAVVCFRHIHDRPDGIRDYDNIECKLLLDVVAMFTLQDDNGSCCDVFHTTGLGKTCQTQVIVMPSERFVSWLQEKQKGLQTP